MTVSPSRFSDEVMRQFPVLFVASLNGRIVGVSTFEPASRDCVSALSLICGSTSAIFVRLRLSLKKGCTIPLDLQRILDFLRGLLGQRVESPLDCLGIECVVKQCVKVVDVSVTARS